ncbi:hypothetical protein HP570_04830 [Brevibacillus sp. RS1.1]|uniref:hypothetical protein n=1 Tax=Brevibacillus sp. RS1.1 TaxID=2738982 RepID=UPI00156BBD05|nr:hypothetical protein [Brevibacillus sp. RS1.1]NRR01554.1 hypothetical protein [Brevibacillus sp. RS1.1]
MHKLLDIGDVFESKEYGTIIVGINPELDTLSHSEIKNRIGDYIVVRTPDYKELEMKVISVQISNSLIDKKTIGICIGKAVNPSDIPIRSVVYTR